MLELTNNVPWEDRMEEEYERKRAKYQALVDDRLPQSRVGGRLFAHRGRQQVIRWSGSLQSFQPFRHHRSPP